MAGHHFDRLARTLHSRRRALQVFGGAGVALGIGRRTLAAPPPIGQPYGCATSQATDYCHPGSVITHCPDNPTGLCVVIRKKGKKRPLCLSRYQCHPCRTNAACAEFDPTARCVKTCVHCGGEGACVVPA